MARRGGRSRHCSSQPENRRSHRPYSKNCRATTGNVVIMCTIFWVSMEFMYLYVCIISTLVMHAVCLNRLCLYLIQVANYGVGGQYEPHFDFSRVSCLNCSVAAWSEARNRIAQGFPFYNILVQIALPQLSPLTVLNGLSIDSESLGLIWLCFRKHLPVFLSALFCVWRPSDRSHLHRKRAWFIKND